MHVAILHCDQIFELSGAYGTVGLSLGYPGFVTSFVAQMQPLSKLIFVYVMLLGRCRGLPDSLDYAVDLKRFTKTDKRKQKEQQNNQIPLEKEPTLEDIRKQVEELKLENERLKTETQLAKRDALNRNLDLF